jgi:aconitase A
VPYKVLIAQVWDASQKSKFIWTISGDSVITDHIAGSSATTPKEVARHFSLKWQMDADRLLDLAKNKAPVENAGAHMETYTKKLIQYAESLYDLASRDDVWL